MRHDSLSDALVLIKNADHVGKDTVVLMFLQQGESILQSEIYVLEQLNHLKNNVPLKTHYPKN